MSCIGRSLTPCVPGPECGPVCLGAGAVVIGGGWAISSPSHILEPLLLAREDPRAPATLATAGPEEGQASLAAGWPTRTCGR